MAGSLQPRVKTWVATEDVEYDDLNAEFDNVLLAMQPLLIDDYSTNAAQMQVTTDPGEVGTESLATTLAGEIARLRFIISEITGEEEWYESPITSLTGLANAIGTGLTDNRLVSGRVRSGSQQPIFLVPNGAARTVKLDGTPTSFIYYIEGTEYTISSDVTLTNLTAAPSSNNTCLVNDTIATADEYWTKYTGENGTEIPVDNMGTEITALVGKFAGFKLSGSTDEYFIAYVASSTSLTKAYRGYFFDSADAPIPRAGYTNNDTITLMKLTWVFAKTDGTLTATYNNPTWSDDEPSSPDIGDYWFDLSANKWKKYDVGSFADADAILVGVCLQDSTNTVAARSFDFFTNYASLNTIEVIAESSTQVKSRLPGGQVNVFGEGLKFDYGITTWDMTLDLDSGVTEGASTYYYFYLTETGDKIISDIRPYDRRVDLQGYYHPHQSWRCVGSAYNNDSSDLTAVNSYYKSQGGLDILPTQTAALRVEVTNRIIPLDASGGVFTHYLPPAALTRGVPLLFHKIGTDFNAATISTVNSENIIAGGVSAATTSTNTNGEMLELLSNGTAYYVMRRYIPGNWVSYTPTGLNLGTLANVDVRWMRQGCNILIRGVFDSGTVVASSPAGITLPGSLVIDSTQIPGDQRPVFGFIVGAIGATGTQIPATAKGPWVVTYDGANTSYLVFSDTVDTDSGAFTLPTASALIGNSARNSINTGPIPITGWGA